MRGLQKIQALKKLLEMKQEVEVLYREFQSLSYLFDETETESDALDNLDRAVQDLDKAIRDVEHEITQ